MIIKLTRWTSDLTIFINEPRDSEDTYIKLVDRILSKLENKYSVFKEDSEVSLYNQGKIDKFDETYDNIKFAIEGGKLLKNCKIDEPLDFTGMLKGMAVEFISLTFVRLGVGRFLVNFGGDLISHRMKSSVKLNDFINLKFPNDSSYGVCTSGNYGRRGKHISTVSSHDFKTLTIFMKHVNLSIQDRWATNDYSFGTILERNSIIVNLEDKIVNHTYCASPFFNEEECKIRDKMISRFNNFFRPDLTDNSKSYSGSPGKELANEILKENLNHIRHSGFLVFPKGTTDLGTLMEVGYAYRIGVPVLRYDPETDKYDLIFSNKLSQIELKEGSVVDCTKLSGALVLGYNHDRGDLKYYIGDLHDNIMLSSLFKRVDQNGNIIEPNYAEVL